MKKDRTEISKVGEFGLIKRITDGIEHRHSESVLGVGDDAAVIDIGDGYLTLSTDYLIENIHFDLTYSPLKHIGYKAISINVSDICAMNSMPKQALMSIAFSNRFSVEAIEELYLGVHTACQYYNIDLMGGDTSSSPQGLLLSGSCTGRVEKQKLTKRRGAKENDLVYVSGNLGAAYLGLMIMKREKKIFLENPEIQPKFDDHKYVVERQLMPRARIDIIKQLSEADIVPSSMIDISDGLGSEALRISQSSGVGISIYEDKIPLHPETVSTAEGLNLSPLTCALSGGEDYELMLTVDQKDYEKAEKINELTCIGYITKKEEGISLITNDNRKIPLSPEGFSHFNNGQD